VARPDKRTDRRQSRRDPNRPLLVAIVGGSGSGKSWLAEKLKAAIGSRAARISLDDFYWDRSYLSPAQRAGINYDHPRAIDWLAVERVLRDCVAGRVTRIPRYDFKTHSRLSRERVLQPKPIVLMDGLWLLRRPSLRRHFALRLYLDCSPATRLRRRLVRDLTTRARTRKSIQEQFEKIVEPMHCRFVEPQSRWAHAVLNEACGKKELDDLVVWVRELARQF
jgi:uridine kinase